MSRHWVIVMICTLLVACISSFYSKPDPELGKDISTISEEYVKATRGGLLDFTAVIPAKVYHPNDGYIHYERLWCLDTEKGSVEEFQALIERICRLRSGEMRGEWCMSINHQRPLFSAAIEQTGTTCTGGDPTTVIYTLEPISSPSTSEWMLSAEALGFDKNADKKSEKPIKNGAKNTLE
ncbi:hypothetical protein L4C36_08810 [Photobacterium japonica]|uniref:hypothetical protein n=1 Tax=Photobacterium japonica TaxID=2910235 RepID=UPI003D0B8B6D